MEGTLLIESIRPHIVKITINRPSALNALNTMVLKELDQLLTTLKNQANDPKHRVRVLVLSGSGEKAFVAGADIKEFLDLDDDGLESYIALGQRVMSKLSSFPAPTIAEVGGYCLGGGLEIALACDFIIANETAKFGFPEVTIGLIPGFGGTQRALRRISSANLKNLVFHGKSITSSDALKIGLIDQVFPNAEFDRSVNQYLDSYLELPELALRAAKVAINNQFETQELSGLQKEVELFKEIFFSKDAIEGRVAFGENRKPTFRGE